MRISDVVEYVQWYEHKCKTLGYDFKEAEKKINDLQLNKDYCLQDACDHVLDLMKKGADLNV